MREKSDIGPASATASRERRRLEARKAEILAEIRAYPAPIAGCDVQYQALLQQRDAVVRDLSRLSHADHLQHNRQGHHRQDGR